jgi:uncharacterized protein YbjT (DUF2867 family)
MIVITGASGNTGKEVALALLQAGKQVKVIGRDAQKLQPLVQAGAIAAIGDLADTEFLTKEFTGAQAVYAMIPPKWDLQEDWLSFLKSMGRSISQAIEKAGVKKVVVLSSNGAHQPSGAGPVTGLYHFEQMLKQIKGLDILTLRAGYFMQNLFGLTGMIRHLGFLGYSLNNTVKVPIVHTRDIAAVAVQYLLNLNFTGFEYVFVPGAADLTMDEVASILGKAIGKDDLKYITFSQQDAKAGMLQNGIPETIADGYNELFDCLNKGDYLSDYQRTAQNTTATTLEWFAEHEFAPAYLAA